MRFSSTTAGVFDVGSLCEENDLSISVVGESASTEAHNLHRIHRSVELTIFFVICDSAISLLARVIQGSQVTYVGRTCRVRLF